MPSSSNCPVNAYWFRYSLCHIVIQHMAERCHQCLCGFLLQSSDDFDVGIFLKHTSFMCCLLFLRAALTPKIKLTSDFSSPKCLHETFVHSRLTDVLWNWRAFTKQQCKRVRMKIKHTFLKSLFTHPPDVPTEPAPPGCHVTSLSILLLS
jgi:hypothetical protein